MAARGPAERLADVRRLLAAARAVHEERARLVPAIAASTGLTRAGVELGFRSLEVDADDASLRRLVASATTATRVHVILSANVFVAPLRALAIARAAAARVTVRPSPRDPTLARALVAAADDPALALVEDRDVHSIEEGEAHVYGRDATIAAIRARVREGVIVRGHGAGMGAAVVTGDAGHDAVDDLARDIVVFDQRGCLSPRVVFVEGGAGRAAWVASSLHDALAAWEKRAPRGALSEDERVEATRWRDGLRFAGEVWAGPAHMVAVAPTGALAIPPSGRHVCIVPASSREVLREGLASIARFLVAAGSDAPAVLHELLPTHVRISPLGEMQRPPLDGPLDRRQ